MSKLQATTIKSFYNDILQKGRIDGKADSTKWFVNSKHYSPST
ncbi:MAG: hypothetical protein ACOX2P_08655 [Bacillota bacterium]